MNKFRHPRKAFRKHTTDEAKRPTSHRSTDENTTPHVLGEIGEILITDRILLSSSSLLRVTRTPHLVFFTDTSKYLTHRAPQELDLLICDLHVMLHYV